MAGWPPIYQTVRYNNLPYTVPLVTFSSCVNGDMKVSSIHERVSENSTYNIVSMCLCDRQRP